MPKDWNVVTVEELGEVVTGTTPSTFNKEYWDGEYPFVTPTDITETKYVEKTERQVTQKGVERGRLIPKDSVLVTCIASIGKITLASEPCITNQQINAIICKEEVDPHYVYYATAFRSNILKTWAGRTTNPIVKKSLFEKFPSALPRNVNEQRKIAEVLSTVDEAIQKTREMIAKTERLKKGLMRQLFTKGIGHKEFRYSQELDYEIAKEWKVAKLGEVNEFRNGINFKKEQRGDKGILTIDVLNMYGQGIYVSFSNLYRVGMSLKQDSDYILKKGDILFVRSSFKQEGVGWTSLFSGWKEPVTFCGFIIRARLNTREVLPEFLVYFLRSDLARKKLIAGSGQVAITNLTQDFLKTMKFPLPLIQEQQEIAHILSTADKKLEIERNEKARLERIKQGMMDLLLTGKIRVKA